MNRGLDLLINFYDFLMVLSLMIKVVVVAISIIFIIRKILFSVRIEYLNKFLNKKV